MENCMKSLIVSMLFVFAIPSYASINLCGYEVDQALYSSSYAASASCGFSVSKALANVGFATPEKEFLIACNIRGTDGKEFVAALLIDKETDRPTMIRFGHYK